MPEDPRNASALSFQNRIRSPVNLSKLATELGQEREREREREHEIESERR